jgi:competence protein ComEC
VNVATRRISAVVEARSVWPVDDDPGWIGRVHRRTDVALGYGLHPSEAAVVRGMVLVDRSLIPEDLDEAFQRSGIAHANSISGSSPSVAEKRTLWASSVRTV